MNKMGHYIKRWEDEKQEIMGRLFTPRIVQDLNQFNIKIEPEDRFLIEESIEEGNAGLFIYGNTGTGKTLYAAAFLLEITKLYKLNNIPFTGLYVGTSEFFQELRNGMFDSSLQSSEICKRYEAADLLVLDDLGTETPTDWVMQTLYMLINTRYEYLRPTIFVSNFGLTALCERFQNDRIPSRIEGMCKTKKFEGKDFRIKGIIKGERECA